MDLRLQKIIENASASVGDQDDHFPVSPFTRAPLIPSSQPTFSRHFNNGSSLQDMFALRPSQPLVSTHLVHSEYAPDDIGDKLPLLLSQSPMLTT
jgi:hypothetical protein